jgi:predicted oxidoreductase
MDDTEEALNRQLENLERLMVSLDISGKCQVVDEEPKENNQIIYDFSSEEEENENPHFVKIEPAETS